MFQPDFSDAALENIEETGADWTYDLERLREGRFTEESLLEHCLDGADDDRVQGWRDYVATLVALGPARDLDDEAACRADALYDQMRDDELTGDA